MATKKSELPRRPDDPLSIDSPRNPQGGVRVELPPTPPMQNQIDDDRLRESFAKFRNASSNVNSTTDRVRKTVENLDQTLQVLNAGVSAWVTICTTGNGRFEDQLGYDRLGTRWGIGIRTLDNDPKDPEDDVVERWPFNDAPRQRRLDAIKKIPDLIEALADAAEALAHRVQKEADRIDRVAATVRTTVELSNKRGGE